MDHWKGEEGTGYGGNTWILYLIYVIWVFFELCFVFYMFVETRGPTLEELVKVIDGPDAQVADIDLGHVEKDTALEAEKREDAGVEQVQYHSKV
ncbi:hypothetical protein HYQ44_001116 [Verticillium longisporum]|nr:hypothetical protein HYQ44_001116 [Verticillium longisporum]